VRHKEEAVSARMDEHPDAAKSVRPMPPLVPEVVGVEDFTHMEAVSAGPEVLTVSLADEIDRVLESLPVPGRCHWNNPIRAATTPAATMMPARRIRSNFGIDLDVGPRL